MQISENIYRIGGAYLVIGDKTALIDTAPRGGESALVHEIEEILRDRQLDYVILNHTEPNRSHGLSAVLERYPDAEVMATVAGIRNLKEMQSRPFRERAAKDNAVLELGNGISLRFIITPNLSWPDSMVTYEENSGTIFTCDLFSDGENLMTYPDYVENALKRLSELKITAVMPAEGDILRGTDIQKAFDIYGELLDKHREQEKNKTALILYSSHYGATREMAECIRGELESAGVTVTMCGADEDTVPNINTFSAIIAGTGTYERGASESVMRALCGVNAVLMRHKPFFTFGSHGWSGEGANILHAMLVSLGMKPFSKPFTSIFNMSDETRERLKRHTRKFAEFILN